MMGLAILFIVMFHQHFITGPITSFFHSYGHFGVDVFLFLSGFGIYYSLNKQKDNESVKSFYMRRAFRIIPTCLIAFICFYYFWKTAFPVTYRFSGPNFICGCFGLDVWYIRTIVIYYLLSPILFRLITKKNRYAFFLFIVLSITIPLIQRDVTAFINTNFPDPVFYRQTLVTSATRFPAYFLGMIVAHGAFSTKVLWDIRTILIAVTCLSLSASWVNIQTDDPSINHCLRNIKNSYSIVLPLLVYIPWVAWVLQKLFPPFLRNIVCWCGKYSLEIFLAHAAFFPFYKKHLFSEVPEYNFIIAFFISVGLAFLLNRLTTLLVSFYRKKNRFAVMRSGIANPVNRNSGLDLLRVLSMFMVCVVHVNLFTKAHRVVIPGHEAFFYWGVITESICFIGVNLYAMLTGFVSIKLTWKVERYVKLWLMVAFYTIVLLICGYFLNLAFPAISWSISEKKLWSTIGNLFLGSEYWYFAAYTGLFMLIPILNRALVHIKKEYYKKLLLVICLVLTTWSIFNPKMVFDGGYNCAWLTALYVVGAYFKLYPVPFGSMRKWVLVIVMIACILQPLIFKISGYPSFFSYTSPFMVVYSVCVFVIFSNLKVQNAFMLRIISILAPVSFSVYLIHMHPFVWHVLKKYVPILNVKFDYLILFPIIAALIIYTSCVIIDHIRIYLFKLLNVGLLNERVSACFYYSMQSYDRFVRKILLSSNDK